MDTKWKCYFFIYSIMMIYFLVLADITKHFSTKTAYEWAYGKRSSNEFDIEDEYFNENIADLECSAVHTNIVSRHGTRFPGEDDINRITEIHKILFPYISSSNSDLKSWVNKFPHNNKKSLAKRGEGELFSFGRRTALRLFSLFVDDNDSNRYIVSSKDRTRESAHFFSEGFSNAIPEDDNLDNEFKPDTMDLLVRFHSLCEDYKVSVDKNASAYKEFSRFQLSNYISTIMRKIVNKLNIPNDVLVTGDPRVMYMICGYEMAILGFSPWCELFDPEDFEVLEYLSDLKHYYKNGPGHAINWKQSCPLISDMFNTMDDVIDYFATLGDEDERYSAGQFYFGHAETLGPIFTALGLYNDSVPPTADNFNKQSARKFRTSLILPFAANLQLILYECEPQNKTSLGDGEDEDEVTVEYYLKMLVNEKPESLPGCTSEMCLYSTVREKLEAYIDSCDFGSICKLYRKKDEF